MLSLQTAALSDEHRADCAALLAERFARQRAAEPLLPQIEDFAARVPQTGVVAIRGGKLVAYVGGELHGDTATIGFGGCAALVPEAVRDCFATAAAEWGVRRFSVAVPVFEHELIDAWFRLAFGCQFVWAVRPAEEIELADFGGLVRPGTRDDLETAIAFDQLVWDTQAGSPTFSDLGRPSLDALRTEWSRVLETSEQYTHFVAERDGRAVGHALLYRRPAGNLRVPEASIDLVQLVTVPEVRGSGVGRALAEHATTYAQLNGYTSLLTEWNSANLAASRFWPRRGFRSQYLRLYRAVP
jgi:GNAT superfamily N-acetyltransferase